MGRRRTPGDRPRKNRHTHAAPAPRRRSDDDPAAVQRRPATHRVGATRYPLPRPRTGQPGQQDDMHLAQLWAGRGDV